MTNYHQVIIDLMTALGYKNTEEGVCKGLVMMAVQAELAGELDKFQKRLQFITNNQHELVQLINEAREIVKKEGADYGKNKTQSLLKEEHKKVLEALSFFDGIILYLTPENYNDLFGMFLSQAHAKDISRIIQSQVIEEEGGLENVFSTSSVYTRNTLSSYLDKVKEIVKNNSISNMAIELSGYNHAISVIYDLKSHKWKLIYPLHLKMRN